MNGSFASASTVNGIPLGGGRAGRFDRLWTALPALLLAYAWAQAAARLNPAVQSEELAGLLALALLGSPLLWLAAGWAAAERPVVAARGARAAARLGRGAALAMPLALLAPAPLATMQLIFSTAIGGVLVLAAAAAVPVRAPARPIPSDIAALFKPGLNGLVLVTTMVGFYMGAAGGLNLPLAAATLLGTGLVAAGASALNQFSERDSDAYMPRTASRPLPAGRIDPAVALRLGAALAVAGLALLALAVSPAAAFLAALTLAVYNFLYTPLKRINTLSTLAGAVSGALPPLIGWVAAAGSLDARAWILFHIMFLWQVPHFLAIAWKYRAQYAAAGMPMYSVLDERGRATGLQMLLYSIALIAVSLLPLRLGMTGWVYAGGALALGLALAWFAAVFTLRPAERAAMRLFFATIIYLPLLLGLMLAFKA